jgi:hypothetical protein
MSLAVVVSSWSRPSDVSNSKFQTRDGYPTNVQLAERHRKTMRN